MFYALLLQVNRYTLCPNLYIGCAERMFYALPLQVNSNPLPQFVCWVNRKDVLSPAVADKLISFGSKCDTGVPIRPQVTKG
jgi:hypothetical protein